MTNTENAIRIDPSDPLAGLWGTTTGASAEEMEELSGMVRARGARVVAVELLSAAASATGWTWGDETLAELTRALDRLTLRVVDIMETARALVPGCSDSRDDEGRRWIWAPTEAREPALDALAGLRFGGVTDGYATYEVI